MTARIKQFKVRALPSTLEPDAIYFVLPVGETVVTTYVTDGAGVARQSAAGPAGGGVSDHGALAGLTDDDHPQYHTDARGDARYAVLAHGHAIADVTGLQTALDTKISAGGLISPGVYAVAELPPALNNLGALAFVTDDVGGSVPAFSDGTFWRRVNDRVVVSAASADLSALFSGVTVGGYWKGDNPANTATTWADSTSLGTNLTNTGTGLIEKFEQDTVRGHACYRNAGLGNGLVNFALPAISINRRAHGFFVFFRTRSHHYNLNRSPGSFGPALTDCLYDTALNKWRAFGTAIQNANSILGRSDMCCFIASAGAGGVKLRQNGVEQTLSAFTAGNVTGGRLFSRTDGSNIQGEVYEAGLLDRELTVDDIAAIEARHQTMFGAWPTQSQVFIEGDSLTEGLGFASDLGWTRLLDDDLHATFKQMSVAQSGTNIQTQAGTAATKAAFFNGGLTKNVAVLCLGTNDLGANARTSTQVLTDMQTWCTAMKGAGWKTIVCTVAARDDTNWNATKEGHRVAVNSGIAGLTGLDAVCDIAGLSVFSDPTNTTYFSTDKLHWTAAAQPAVKDAVKSAVLSV